jgi:hypothetical protein
MIYKIIASMCVGLVASVLFMPNSKSSKKMGRRCRFCDVSVERGFDVVWEVRCACSFCSVRPSNPFSSSSSSFSSG